MIFGMAHGGAKRHGERVGVSPFGLMVSLCGRVIVPGDSDAPLCKSCARIGKIVELPKIDGDAWAMIHNCKSDHRHIDPQTFTTRKHTATELAMFRDVLSDYATGAENDECWIGTLMLVTDAPKLTREVITPELGKRQDGGNPNAGMIDPNNAKPARNGGITDAQKSFIESLLTQVDEMEILIHGENAISFRIFDESEINAFDKKRASQLIESLKTQIEKRKPEANAKRLENRKAEAKVNPAEDGYYVLGETFICIKWNRAHTGQYATTWDGDSWVYDGAASRQLVADAKAGRLSRMTPEDAKRFGDLYGQCFKCSRTLTDPESIAAGYGPICAGKMGW